MTKQSLHHLIDAGLAARPSIPVARLDPAEGLVELPPLTSLRADAAGRWRAVRIEGQLYRRVLDGRVVVYPDPAAAPLDVADPTAIHGRVAALAQDLARQFSNPAVAVQFTGTRTDRTALLDFLQRVGQLSPADYQRERAQFRSTYDEAIEILPPDRYQDVVVLPATGCPNAQCTFCAFYQGRYLKKKSLADLAIHLEAVRIFLGPALALRTGVFLGSASALSLAQDHLLEVLRLVRDTLGVLPRGVSAFWDPDHSPPRKEADWIALAKAGLRTAYVGLETGLAPLRAAVGKSGDLTRLHTAIHTFRAALAATPSSYLGVILLVGLGGASAAAAHRDASVASIASLGLSRRDIVYLSPLKGELSDAELSTETEHFRKALRAITPARVVPYAIDAFRYYA